MKKKSKLKNLTWLIPFVMGGLIGGFSAGFFLSGESDDISIFSFALFMLAVILAMHFQIIIHELGHFIFGLLTGYTFSSFRIGSFMLMSEDEKIKLKHIKIAGTSGQCLMVPPKLKNDTMPCVLYGLGGCFANIIISIMFLILYIFVSNVLFLNMFCLLTIICGIAFALLNGIPVKGMVANDGYNVLEQKRNKKAAYSLWVQLSVNEKLSKGESLKDIPDEWLYMLEEQDLANVLIAAIGVFYTNRILAMQKFPESAEAIDRLLQEDVAICDLHRKLLVCDKIYCELVSGKSYENIESLYTKEQKQFMKQMKKFPSVLRTNYAIELLCHKNNSSAEKILKSFHAVAKTYPYQGDIKDELELIKIVANYATTDF